MKSCFYSTTLAYFCLTLFQILHDFQQKHPHGRVDVQERWQTLKPAVKDCVLSRVLREEDSEAIVSNINNISEGMCLSHNIKTVDFTLNT